MYYAATAAIFVTMVLALTRALLGPTVYDRVLAVNRLINPAGGPGAGAARAKSAED